MKTVLFAFLSLTAVASATSDEPLSIQKALMLARGNRPSIAAAEQRVLGARFHGRASRAFPATRLLVGRSDPVEVGGTDDDFVLSQPIDLFGRTSAARAGGDAAIGRAEADLRHALADLQRQVLMQYGEAAAYRAHSENALRSEEIAQRLHDSIETLVAEGRLPGVHLARVGIELERAKLTSARRRAELRAATRRLAGLLNVPESQAQVPGFAVLSLSRPDRAEIASRRPDLMAIASEVRTAEAEAKLARLALLPELELEGRRTAWQESPAKYGLRIQLTLPLFDSGRSRDEAKAATLLAKAAEKSLEDATKIAEAEVDAAWIELEASEEEIRRFEAIDLATHELVAKSRIGFDERAVTLVELLEATRALREVEEGMAEAKLRLALAQAEYLRASGQLLEVGP